MEKKVTKITPIISSILLIFYPGVLAAGLMGIAANSSSDNNLFFLITTYTFFITTMLYPIVCILSWIGYFTKKQLLVYSPQIHIGLCVLLMIIWSILSSFPLQ